MLRLSGARFSVLQSLSMNLTVSRLSLRLLVTCCSPDSTSSASLLDLGSNNNNYVWLLMYGMPCKAKTHSLSIALLYYPYRTLSVIANMLG